MHKVSGSGFLTEIHAASVHKPNITKQSDVRHVRSYFDIHNLAIVLSPFSCKSVMSCCAMTTVEPTPERWQRDKVVTIFLETGYLEGSEPSRG